MAWNRYGVYWLPRGPLGRAGAGWLGWNARAGEAMPDPGPDTEGPRRYGFHATLKPPFRLRGGEGALRAAGRTLAAALAPVAPVPFAATRMGRFLALRPEEDGPARALAAALVEGLDAFRLTPPPEEVARRRAQGLTPRQAAMLRRWGYPFVMGEHRLHLTLTGPDPSAAVEAEARDRLAPALAAPHGIDRAALVGEDGEGRFHLLEEWPLGG